MPTLSMSIKNFTQRRMLIAIEPWGDYRTIRFGEQFDLLLDWTEPNTTEWVCHDKGFSIYLGDARATVSRNGKVVLDYNADGCLVSAPWDGDEP
jgi:hypothetical protein